MDFFSDVEAQISLMDSELFSDSASCINFVGETEELNRDFFCLPFINFQQESLPLSSSSSLTETLSTSNVRPEELHLKKRKKQSNEPKRKSTREEKRSSVDKKVMEENNKPQSDYIHVRARRGQATDSHSLAERVRRERISVRMKTLQGLVPGCEKVIGKALVLDEIINYVESLKNQVEFLSMKLASLNPILCEFGSNFEDFTSMTENHRGNSELLSSIIQPSHIKNPGDLLLSRTHSDS